MKYIVATILVLLNFSTFAQTESRPQLPVPPFNYIEEEVTVFNEKDKINLSGTLTLPKGDGPFACAIMITGSGPQNRNEELMGHQPFAVIADYLTNNGYAVLRMDDRGVGKSEGNHAISTSFDFADDILSGFTFLTKDKRINPSKIGLIGHSEGGLISAIVGAKEPKIAFIISLGGVGVSIYEVLKKQNFDITVAEGGSKEVAQSNQANLIQMLDVVASTPDSLACSQKLTTLIDSLYDYQKPLIPDFDAFVQSQIAFLNSRWIRAILKYDPADDWKKVKCPVLALNGEKDIQVDAEINLNAIAAALDSGKNYKYQTTIMSGLNHLFQTCTTCRVSEYGSLSETFSQDALEEMKAWLNRNVQ
jgi:pimeloyl-ACP methyl ester carboxylesterase